MEKRIFIAVVFSIAFLALLSELVKAREPNRTDFPFAIEAKDQELEKRINNALFAVSERFVTDAHILEYHWSDGSIAVTKTFTIGPAYQFDFAVNITPAVPYRVAIGPGIRTLAPDE